MQFLGRHLNPRPVVIASMLAITMALAACGGDDDASPSGGDDPSTDTSPSGDGAPDDDSGIAGSASDDDLLVPRQYLQGEWCDSDGGSWTIEGDIATLGDDDGGTGEFPLDVLFIDGPGVSLFSQTDDEFVFGSSEERVTFTRGSC